MPLSLAHQTASRPVPANDHDIRPCPLVPHEDPASNGADAEREAEMQFQLNP
jgi:hypothetical protein